MSDSDDDGKPISAYRCKEIIYDILIQSGQKHEMMNHIRHMSIQHGWFVSMRNKFIEYIKKKGPENVNVSHMIGDLAPTGKSTIPADMRGGLLDSLVEVMKDYFIIDDTIPPQSMAETENADKTFLFQSHDIKPDPGLGVGVEAPDSPPPSGNISDSTVPIQCPTRASANDDEDDEGVRVNNEDEDEDELMDI